MTKRKKIIKIVACVLAFCLIAASIVIPCLYVNGQFAPARPLYKAKDGQIKVACVGDSITYGAAVKNWTKNNYPTILGGLLGENYCVNNYGYSGRTAMYDGDFPFFKERLYQKSLKFVPDVVIIMFGSNDSKPQNWKGAEAFINDFSKLIDGYIQVNPSVRICILTPPPAFEKGKEVKFSINKTIVADEIRPAVKTIAERKGIECLDMYAVFDNRPELFADGVHPNAEGAKLFAETVKSKIFS